MSGVGCCAVARYDIFGFGVGIAAERLNYTRCSYRAKLGKFAFVDSMTNVSSYFTYVIHTLVDEGGYDS